MSALCKKFRHTVRAEIHAGELLKKMAEAGLRDKGGRGALIESQRATQSSDLGLTKDESSRFQQAAAAPADALEQAFQEARTNQVPVTSAQIRELTKQPDFTPQQRADHERLWHVLLA